jgi:hypothetical protein
MARLPPVWPAPTRAWWWCSARCFSGAGA